MANEGDLAHEMEEYHREVSLSQVPREIPKGRPGECDLCGEWSGRLVRGACAPCRDRYRLP